MEQVIINKWLGGRNTDKIIPCVIDMLKLSKTANNTSELMAARIIDKTIKSYIENEKRK